MTRYTLQNSACSTIGKDSQLMCIILTLAPIVMVLHMRYKVHELKKPAAKVYLKKQVTLEMI